MPYAHRGCTCYPGPASRPGQGRSRAARSANTGHTLAALSSPTGAVSLRLCECVQGPGLGHDGAGTGQPARDDGRSRPRHSIDRDAQLVGHGYNDGSPVGKQARRARQPIHYALRPETGQREPSAFFRAPCAAWVNGRLAGGGGQVLQASHRQPAKEQPLSMDEAAARGVIISPLGRSARSSPPPTLLRCRLSRKTLPTPSPSCRAFGP